MNQPIDYSIGSSIDYNIDEFIKVEYDYDDFIKVENDDFIKVENNYSIDDVVLANSLYVSSTYEYRQLAIKRWRHKKLLPKTKIIKNLKKYNNKNIRINGRFAKSKIFISITELQK